MVAGLRLRGGPWAAACVLFLAAQPAAAGTSGPAGRLARSVDAVVDAAIAKGRVVGMVVVVMRDGVVIYRRAAGFADREDRRPMTPASVFRLASVSKLFVSAAAISLVDRGRLQLDAPVSRWLPRFLPAAPDGARPTITVRQLLTHTAGMTYPFAGPEAVRYRSLGVSSGLEQPGLGMEEELGRIAEAGLIAPPGTRWNYSVSIDVLGAVIEAADGRALPLVVADAVTRPLGLRHAGFAVAAGDRLATAYYAKPGGMAYRMAPEQDVDFPDGSTIRFAPGRVFDRRSFPSGGAGMVATAGDVAGLLDAIRRGGGAALGPAGARSMMVNQIGGLATPLGPGWGFGFGGAVVTDASKAGTPQSTGTWTWGGVYGNSWFVDPARRLTLVALTNTAPEGESGAFPNSLRDAVYRALRRKVHVPGGRPAARAALVAPPPRRAVSSPLRH